MGSDRFEGMKEEVFRRLTGVRKATEAVGNRLQALMAGGSEKGGNVVALDGKKRG